MLGQSGLEDTLVLVASVLLPLLIVVAIIGWVLGTKKIIELLRANNKELKQIRNLLVNNRQVGTEGPDPQSSEAKVATATPEETQTNSGTESAEAPSSSGDSSSAILLIILLFVLAMITLFVALAIRSGL